MDIIDLFANLFGASVFLKIIYWGILVIALIKIYTTSARTKRIEEELHKLRKINQQLLDMLQPAEEPEEEYTEADDEITDDKTEFEPYLGDYQGD